MFNDIQKIERYQIEYNNRTPENFGAFLPDYPEITSAKRRYKEITIPGMSGNLITNEQSYDNITITCTLSFIHKKPMYLLDNLKSWLRGTGRLRLSDMQDRYYEVLAVNTTGIERQLRRYGYITVEFICYPYQFLNTGEKALSNTELTHNPYDLCKPVYTITGNGTFTLNVNGKSITATIGETVAIDSRRMIAYRVRDGQWINTVITGDYADLWLKNGVQNITITQGFNVMIQPYWGWLA